MSQPTKEPEKRLISWEEVDQAVEHLASRLNGSIAGFYGIPRGGLVLATMLSYKMGKPLLLAPIEGCVVVDDVADTGETLQHYTKYPILTMFKKSWSAVMPTYHWENCDDWLVFPWEMEA